MIYIILLLTVVAVLLVAASHDLKVRGCQGDCDQGRKTCNCKGKE